MPRRAFFSAGAGRGGPPDGSPPPRSETAVEDDMPDFSTSVHPATLLHTPPGSIDVFTVSDAFPAATTLPVPTASGVNEEDEDELLASPSAPPLPVRGSGRSVRPSPARMGSHGPASGIVGTARAFAIARMGRLRLTDVLADTQRTAAARAAVAATREELSLLHAQAADQVAKRVAGGHARGGGEIREALSIAAGTGVHADGVEHGRGGRGDSRDGDGGGHKSILGSAAHTSNADGLLLAEGDASCTRGIGGGAPAGWSWDDSQDGLPLDSTGEADPVLVAARRLARDGCVSGGLGGVTIDAAADLSPRQVFVAPPAIPSVPLAPPSGLDHPLAQFFCAAASAAAIQDAGSGSGGSGGGDDKFSVHAAVMLASCTAVQPQPALATWLLRRVAWPARDGQGGESAAAVLSNWVTEGDVGEGIGWTATAAVLESYGAVLEVPLPIATGLAAANRVANPSTFDGAVEWGLPSLFGGGWLAVVALRRVLGLASRSLRAARARRPWVEARVVSSWARRGGFFTDAHSWAAVAAIRTTPRSQTIGAIPTSDTCAILEHQSRSESIQLLLQKPAMVRLPLSSLPAAAAAVSCPSKMEMDILPPYTTAASRCHMATVVWEPAPWRAEADVAAAITTSARLLLCSTGATLLGPSLHALIITGLDWYSIAEWPAARARLAAATAADLTGPDPWCQEASSLHALVRALPAASHRSIAWTAAVAYEVLVSLGRRCHHVSACDGAAIGQSSSRSQPCTPYYTISDVAAAVVAGTDAAADARPPLSPLLARLAIVRFTSHALADPAVLAASRPLLPAFDAALSRLLRDGDGRGAGAAPSLMTGPDLVQLRLGVAAIRGMVEAFAPLSDGREE